MENLLTVLVAGLVSIPSGTENWIDVENSLRNKRSYYWPHL